MDAGNLLGQRANLTPNREALLELDTGIRYTYKQLNNRANRAANWLLSLGIGYGDRISILAHNSVVYLDLFYGAAKIGAVFAPLNWRLVAQELVYIVNDCAPKIIFCDPDFAPLLSEMQPHISVEHFASLNGAEIQDAIVYEAAYAAASTSEPPRPSELNPETPHCILYTSGTTGRPKGAIIPQRQVLWNCINTAVSWGLNENDVSPVFTPMFHAGGLFAFLTPLFYLGGRIILGKGFDVEASMRVILEEKCSVILGVPTLFQMWLNMPNFDDLDFSHVRFFISGGAPCPVPLMQEWRARAGTVFRQGYGLSEVGPNCFSMTDADSVPKSGSVGKPIFHSEMRLVDEQGNNVPPGIIGELLIRGPHVCSGYLNNLEATQAALVDGWFHTGDMACMDADGFYTIAGRFKDMIISGGENVYAAEVEAVFMQHTAVQECALIGQPDDKWGEVGLMITVLKPGHRVSESDLRDHCYTQLARYKVPKQVIFTDALPYSPYGKVEKAKLREQFL
ncbi:MAG: long-chain fatty acid--CoA ligase [Anaerolineales bacterium]|nr:long-chain fatty acid--CoA ligase [Anaerolineales bacterium]